MLPVQDSAVLGFPRSLAAVVLALSPLPPTQSFLSSPKRGSPSTNKELNVLHNKVYLVMLTRSEKSGILQLLSLLPVC